MPRRVWMLMALFVPFLVPSLAQARAASITITPMKAPPGTMLTITASGFAPNEQVFVMIDAWVQGGIYCGFVVGGNWEDYFNLKSNEQGRVTFTYRAVQHGDDNIGLGFSLSARSADAPQACFTFDLGTSQTFSQTGQTISGRFYDFWLHTGGLPIFGYPITPAANERNYDTGKVYQTQWLERNRFELHSENKPPYDVLLGRLGAERLLQIGRDWVAEGRERGPLPGCLWFPQTGHNVCNQGAPVANDATHGFADFWREVGLEFDGHQGSSYEESLALWGYPLTSAKVETNSSGDTVITQWFERARFEWHDNFVQLGLLGREVASLP